MNYYSRHIGDYAKKAGRLSLLEHGVYTILMDSIYDREQFPTEDEAIDWTWARTDAEVEAVKFVLRKFFTIEDGRYIQNRIKDELNAYKETCEKNARIAKEREEKRKSAKPAVNESLPEKHEACTSGDEACTNRHLTNNQEPITNNHKELSNDNSKGLLAQGEQQQPASTAKPKPKSTRTPKVIAEKPDDVSDQVWREFLTIRKDKPTPLVISGIREEAEQVGLSLEDAVIYAIRQGWQSFRSDWWMNREKPVATVAPMQNHFAAQHQPAQPQSKMMRGIAKLQAMKRAE